MKNDKMNIVIYPAALIVSFTIKVDWERGVKYGIVSIFNEEAQNSQGSTFLKY